VEGNSKRNGKNRETLTYSTIKKTRRPTKRIAGQSRPRERGGDRSDLG